MIKMYTNPVNYKIILILLQTNYDIAKEHGGETHVGKLKIEVKKANGSEIYYCLPVN